MGDISDYYRNQELNFNLEFNHKPRVVTHSEPFTWWVKADGRKTKVTKMTDEHIMNCINMIDDRGRNWRYHWKEPLLKELESR
jgi:hypothetical protein